MATIALRSTMLSANSIHSLLSPSLEEAIRSQVHYIVKNILGKGSLKRPMLSKPSI